MKVSDNKTVLITGAAGAIAKGVICKFAQSGAKLILADLERDAIQAQVDNLDTPLSDYIIVTGDFGKPDEVDAALQSAHAKFGKIGVLAHTVGGYSGGSPVHETELATLEKQLYLNTKIVFVTFGRVAKYMLEHDIHGSLVAILARTGLDGAKNTAAYAASKAAAQRIIESMALELKDHHIRVNGVMPSTADTPANREAMPDADYAKWVTPEQIAEAIFFLASDASSAITGQAVGVYNRA